jgi:hypothetical protein
MFGGLKDEGKPVESAFPSTIKTKGTGAPSVVAPTVQGLAVVFVVN